MISIIIIIFIVSYLSYRVGIVKGYQRGLKQSCIKEKLI